MKTAPHYLLLTDTDQHPDSPTGGRWRFVLEPIQHGHRIEAEDVEPHVYGERLNLLAVVRGVEALEQPSKVTLITPSKYVGRGLRRDLNIWRDNDWQWERYGQRVEIKHADLWKRIDRAREFHRIDCRIWEMGSATVPPAAAEHLGHRRRPYPDVPEPFYGPYEVPFSGTQGQQSQPSGRSRRQSSFNDAQDQHGRRKIVLTTERMNDHLLEGENWESLKTKHSRLFKATKKGWTRVTEIVADMPLQSEFPQAFGVSAN